MSERPEDEIPATDLELPAIEFDSPGRFAIHNPAAETTLSAKPEPAPFQLGKHQTLERFASADLARAHALALLQQARRRICIYSGDLEPWLYNHSSVQDACTQLLLASPRNQLHILVQDVRRAVQDGHRLINLSRRLSSNCSIRRVNPEHPASEGSFLLVDDCALWIRPEPGQYAGYVYYSNPGRLRQQLQLFEQAWSYSLSDPDLRSFLL